MIIKICIVSYSFSVSPPLKDSNDNTITAMPLKKPCVVMRRGKFFCPVSDCDWSCTNSRSYGRHWDGKHRRSFKFICKRCGAGHDRADLAKEHAKPTVCKGSRAANDLRRGPKPRYAAEREADDLETDVDETGDEESGDEEERLEEVERENQKLVADVNQLLVEKEQLKVKAKAEKQQLKDMFMAEKEKLEEKFQTEKEKFEAEKKESQGLREHVERLEAKMEEMEQLQVKYDAAMMGMKVYVGRLEANMKEMEADEPVEEVADDAMDVGKETLLEEEEDSSSRLNLEWDGEDGEVLEEQQLVEQPLVEQHLVGGQPENMEERLENMMLVKPPLRRSTRKNPDTRRREKQEVLETKLQVTDDALHGLQIETIPEKGRAVVASRSFLKGEFVVEYDGLLLDMGTASLMESSYSMDLTKGSFMFYFHEGEQQYCIDATEESGRYGRLINHSKKNPNISPKVVMLNTTPRLIFLAKFEIMPGQELLYDYGDRSPKSILAFPWLAE